MLGRTSTLLRVNASHPKLEMYVQIIQHIGTFCDHPAGMFTIIGWLVGPAIYGQPHIVSLYLQSWDGGMAMDPDSTATLGAALQAQRLVV